MFYNKEAKVFEFTPEDINIRFNELKKILDGETLVYFGKMKVRQSLAAWYKNSGYIHPEGLVAFDYFLTHAF
jgi:hypothetical protein